MKRRFRLTRSIDIKRVRRSGKSFAHPLLVLYVMKADHPVTRVGVTAGVTAGNAVQRNRAKRLLRAAMSDLMPSTLPEYDLMLIARAPLPEAKLEAVRSALTNVLQRAGLLSPTYDG